MRILVLSDLLLELPFNQYTAPDEDTFDTVIPAGDIHSGTEGVYWAKETFSGTKPVYYLPGNHEFYGFDIDCLVEQMRHAASNSQVRLLWRDAVQHDCDTVIIGATLWTDYKLGGIDEIRAMDLARRGVADHRRMLKGVNRFQPEDARALFNEDRRFIEESLAASQARRPIVVTHHLPSSRCADAQWHGSPLNAAFASDLDDLVSRSSVSIHGHTHASVDFTVGNSRVVANPAGYPRNGVERENAAFEPARIIEIA